MSNFITTVSFEMAEMKANALHLTPHTSLGA